MSSEPRESLLTRLLLKHPDSTPEEYQEFYTGLIEHRFSRMLHLYDTKEEIVHEQTEIRTLPAEWEISSLLNAGHPELFLKNLLYHLRRNKKVIPPALLPAVLTQFKDHSDLWTDIYHQHPELVLALAQDIGQWNYLLRAFEPDITLEIGSPGYYEALQVRMQVMPLRTSAYIREIHPEISPVQQARLLQILHEDPSPETRQFITAQINHSRKPVRLAALKSCILRKEENVYDLLRDRLVDHLKNPKESSPPENLPASWKDLASLTEETSRENILIALIDPEEYMDVQDHSFQTEHRKPLLKAAILHRSQETLYVLVRDAVQLLPDPDMIKAIDSKTATRLLNTLAIDSKTSFDQAFIDLLARVDLFLSESDSGLVWQKFVDQWDEMPFTLEELPLELLALRIHPNQIKSIWQHPLLQETSPPLLKIREILKNRLAFLKKCYRS